MQFQVKFKTRILGGVLIPCFVFSVALAVVYYQLGEIKAVRHLRSQAGEVTLHAERFDAAASNMVSSMRGYILFPAQEKLASDYAASLKQAGEELAYLRQRVSDPQQLRQIDRMDSVMAQLIQITNGQMALVRAGKPLDAQANVQTGEGYRSFEKLLGVVGEFRAREARVEQELINLTDDKLSEVLLTIGAALAISLALSVLAGYVVARRVGNSLDQMIAAIAASTSELAASSAQHEGAMSKQAASVSETSASVAELVATSQSSQDMAQASAKAAEEARDAMNRSMALSQQNQDNMENTGKTVGHIAQGIVGLSEQVTRLGDISRLVGDLAANTNMLALNAAVEAARAGDSGAGFAVVANEIRKLADESRKSSGHAGQIVADIQKAANSLVMMTEDSSRSVATAMESVRQATATFVRVKELSEDVNRNAVQVSLFSRQQSAALSQIDAAMSMIDSGAKEMSVAIGQSRVGNENLVRAADNLRKML